MIDRPIDHKALFEQMPVSRFLIEKSGERFVVCEVNTPALGFFAKPKNEIIDFSIDDLFTKENAKRMNESLQVCMEKKTTVTVPPLPKFPGNIDVPGFWINPVFDENDQIIWLDVIAQPSITDSSIVERERDDALLLLTSIFDVSEVGILVFDRNRRIVKINDSFERIYGWNRKDTLGKDFVEFITDDEHAQAEENYEDFMRQGGRNSGEVKLLCKDGSVANAMYTSATLQLSHGRRFQVTTLVDITKRKQMEFSLKLAKEQADAANHAKSAFLANMSHELRTPLNAIIGFSEMMMKETFGPMGNEKYSEYMGDVHLSARHLLEIINEVLDMSKIEAGRVELDEQEIDVPRLVATVVRIMTSRMINSEIKIVQNIPDDLVRLYADPRLIRQILINLLTNAVKYSPNGGTISVMANKDQNGALEMIVEDEGIGIPADKIQEALEPFGQIHDPIKSSTYQGTGLGLPLAKAMVELHGGAFELSSAAEQGTKITMSFPKERIRQEKPQKSILDTENSNSVSEIDLTKSAQ